MLSRLLVDLALLCGQPDNVLFLFEGCNEVRAWELGCAPDRLPGSLVSVDRETLEFFRTAWGRSDIALKRGLDVMGMIRERKRTSLRRFFFSESILLRSFPIRRGRKKHFLCPIWSCDWYVPGDR